MRPQLHAQLTAIARREAGNLAEDVVQDALLIAVTAGRHDFEVLANARWLAGVVRNRARMAARTERRRRTRDDAWSTFRKPAASTEVPTFEDILDGLSPALRTFAALVLSGQNRREIAYLLGLPDTALRQRISALRRHLSARGLAAPEELLGLNLNLTYGRLRAALLLALRRQGGSFASHDPDGHVFLVRRSQTPPPWQLSVANQEEGPA